MRKGRFLNQKLGKRRSPAERHAAARPPELSQSRVERMLLRRHTVGGGLTSSLSRPERREK